MFIFRVLKKIVVLVLMIAGVLYIADYKWKGQSIKDHVAGAYSSGIISEGIKDISTWIESIFHVGKKITKGDELTDKDRKDLEDLLRMKDLQTNVKQLKEEALKKGEQVDLEKALVARPEVQKVDEKGAKK